jgi:rhodanese-related sulfurtransferase
MSRLRLRLTLNQKLAAAAVAMGIVALGADPHGGPRVMLDTKELALRASRDLDRTSVLELADWIVQGRADYRLIDVRDETAFAEYHIPTAEPVPMSALMEYPLLRNEKIVIYGDDVRSAQGWFLLKATGFKAVYILDGGIDAWRDGVLFPVFSADPTPFQRARDEKLAGLSLFFGGQPQSGHVGDRPRVPRAPEMKLSAPVAVPVGQAARKKKKEGC